MTEKDMRAFSELLIAVSDLYSKKMTTPAIKIYYESLKRYTLDDVKTALSSHVQNPDCGQFMPKPADIIRALDGDSGSASLRAWTKVADAIRLYGAYHSVCFDDPKIAVVVVEMGGWQAICKSSADEMPFKCNEFRKRYQSYHMTRLDSAPRLCGIIESENKRHGLEYKDIRFIGDKAKAKALLFKPTKEYGASSVGNLINLGDFRAHS